MKRNGFKMKLFLKRSHSMMAAALVFASVALAQTTTTVTLTGTGDNATLGNVYVDPYTATVGGVAGTAVICDDWSNNSYVDESWLANVINADAVGSSSATPMFGDNQSLYNELAWLGSQLLANPTNTTAQTEISFAMWDLTYGVNSTYEEIPAPLTYLSENLTGGTSNAEYVATQNLITEAEGEGNYNAAGWEILTPAGDGYVGGTDMGVPQEFLVYTPEAPAIILFAADILGLLSLGFFFRRRLLRPIS